MKEQKVLHIGIAPRDFVKRRTIEIANGSKPLTKGEPKLWVSSLESLGRMLSDKNLLLLEMIRSANPQSVTELAHLSGRAKSNLSRTLSSMERLGLIELKDRGGGRKVPTVVYDEVQFKCSINPPKPKAA